LIALYVAAALQSVSEHSSSERRVRMV